MKKYNIVIFADHNIGYDIVEYLILQSNANLIGIYTNFYENKRWWKNIFRQKEIYPEIDVKEYINEEIVLIDIKDKCIDLIFTISWKYIISSKIIDIPLIGVVNLHFSMLPKYKGTFPNVWPIIEGEEETGVTFHFINDKIDAGDIIAQKKVSIKKWDTAKTLLPNLEKTAFLLFKGLWEDVTPDNFKKIAKTQKNKNKIYYSTDYDKINEIDLTDRVLVEDFINLLRGKSFYPEYKNLYFIDKQTGKKIFIVANFFIDD